MKDFNEENQRKEFLLGLIDLYFSHNAVTLTRSLKKYVQI